jgi:hypothetical protein
MLAQPLQIWALHPAYHHRWCTPQKQMISSVNSSLGKQIVPQVRSIQCRLALVGALTQDSLVKGQHLKEKGGGVVLIRLDADSAEMCSSSGRRGKRRSTLPWW